MKLTNNSRPNPQRPIAEEPFRKLLDDVIKKTTEAILQERQSWEDKFNPQLSRHMNELEKLRGVHKKQLEFDFGDTLQGERTREKKAQREREIDKMFDEYLQWIEDTMTTERKPYIRIAAVAKGGF